MLIKSESIKNIVAALLQAKKEFRPVLKLKENPFFKRDGKPSKYADLETAIEATETALSAHGLVISQFPINESDRVGALTILMHESGEFIGCEFALPLAKLDAQTGVGAVTYARRTGYLSVLSIAAEDDDGNTAVGHNQTMGRVKPADKPAQKIETAVAPPEVMAEQNKPAPIVPGSSDLPNSEQLEANRQQIIALQKDLSAVGLKSSRNLPAHRKLLMFLLKSTGRAEVKEITTPQWNNIFQYVEKARTEDGGLEKLAKTINSIKMEEENSVSK